MAGSHVAEHSFFFFAQSSCRFSRLQSTTRPYSLALCFICRYSNNIQVCRCPTLPSTVHTGKFRCSPHFCCCSSIGAAAAAAAFCGSLRTSASRSCSKCILVLKIFIWPYDVPGMSLQSHPCIYLQSSEHRRLEFFPVGTFSSGKLQVNFVVILSP